MKPLGVATCSLLFPAGRARAVATGTFRGSHIPVGYMTLLVCEPTSAAGSIYHATATFSFSVFSAREIAICSQEKCGCLSQGDLGF